MRRTVRARLIGTSSLSSDDTAATRTRASLDPSEPPLPSETLTVHPGQRASSDVVAGGLASAGVTPLKSEG